MNHSRHRVVGLLLILAVIAGLTAGCKREKDKKLEVEAAIDKTERLARRFVYLDTTKNTRTQVNGIIEDDFRFHTQLDINGDPVSEEIASDDAFATRFLDPSQLPNFLDPTAINSALSSGPTVNTNAQGTVQAPPSVVLQALTTRHWVLDNVGAPQALGGVGGTQNRVQGEDPTIDALSELEYVRQAVQRAVVVRKYSKESIEPVYKAAEDPFPKPSPDSPTKRYDLKAPSLPRAESTGGTGNQVTPEAAHFRKMVVYVRDGRVVEVQEQIDVASKLRDLIASFRLPKDTTVDQAVAGINAVRRGQSSDPIRIHKMRLQFSRLGEPLKVDLPTDAIPGSLTLLKHRGRVATTATGSAA